MVIYLTFSLAFWQFGGARFEFRAFIYGDVIPILGTAIAGRPLASVLLTFNKRFDIFWNDYVRPGIRTQTSWVRDECPTH